MHAPGLAGADVEALLRKDLTRPTLDVRVIHHLRRRQQPLKPPAIHKVLARGEVTAKLLTDPKEGAIPSALKQPRRLARAFRRLNGHEHHLLALRRQTRPPDPTLRALPSLAEERQRPRLVRHGGAPDEVRKNVLVHRTISSIIGKFGRNTHLPLDPINNDGGVDGTILLQSRVRNEFAAPFKLAMRGVNFRHRNS